MNSEPESLTKKLILTTKGQLQPPTESSCLIIPHQPLHFSPSTQQSKPLTLQTLQFHKQTLLTLQNTSITPTLLDHQIYTLHTNLPQLNGKTLIIDSSSCGQQQKTAEVFSKCWVVRGYSFNIPKVYMEDGLSLSKEAEILGSKQNIYKEVQYTFGVRGDQQRGFIGEIDFSLHYKLVKSNLKFYNQVFTNLINSYSQYSSKTGCPIFINLLPHGTQSHSPIPPTLPQQSPLLLHLLPQSCHKNTILINPQFNPIRQTSNNKDKITFTNKNQSQIRQLYKKGFTFIFDICRYQKQYCLLWICQFMIQFPLQTIVGAGLKYKTDFCMFGGEGLGLGVSGRVMREGLGEKFEECMRNSSMNMIRLLAWYEKKIVVVKVKMWKCVKCGKQSPQTEQSFRKFNKDFCTIDCLKSYKF